MKCWRTPFGGKIFSILGDNTDSESVLGAEDPIIPDPSAVSDAKSSFEEGFKVGLKDVEFKYQVGELNDVTAVDALIEVGLTPEQSEDLIAVWRSEKGGDLDASSFDPEDFSFDSDEMAG